MKNLYVLISIIALISNSNRSIAQPGWKWGFQSTGASLEAWTTVVDRNSNVYVSGIAEANTDSVAYVGTDTIHLIPGLVKMIITKVDSSGNFNWALTSRNSDVAPIDMAIDAFGNLFLYGQYDSAICNIDTVTLLNPARKIMYFIAKITTAGRVLWAHNVTSQSYAYGIGPIYALYGYGNMALDANGNIFITGSYHDPSIVFNTTTLTNSSSAGITTDAFLAKYNSSGYLQWVKNYGGTNGDNLGGMAINKNGEIYVIGMSNSASLTIGATTFTDTTHDNYGKLISYSFLSKFSNSGNPLWSDSLSFNLGFSTIKVDNHENIYMTGNYNKTLILGTDTLKHDLSGYPDAAIVRYQHQTEGTHGNFVWARYGRTLTKNDIGFSISIDACDNLWVSGMMGGIMPMPTDTMFFGSNYLLPPAGSYDPLFLVNYDTLGNYLYGIALATGGDDASGMAMDNRGNFYVGGDIRVAQLLLGPDTLSVANSNEPMFIGKYHYGACNSIKTEIPTAAPTSLDISVYPNPASEGFTISSNIPFSLGAQAILSDLSGRTITTQFISGNQFYCSLAGFAPGMYLCKIISSDGLVVVKKVVVR